MKNHVIWFLSFLLFISFAFPVFGQSSYEEESEMPCLDISDDDCKNFAKYYREIDKEFEELGMALDKEAAENYSDTAENILIAEQVLEKYGISGPGRVAKIYAIVLGYSLISYDKSAKKDFATSLFMKSTGLDSLTSAMTNLLNPSDYAVINKNYPVLDKALRNDSASESKAAQKSLQQEEEENVMDSAKKKLKDKAKNDLKKTIKGLF